MKISTDVDDFGMILRNKLAIMLVLCMTVTLTGCYMPTVVYLMGPENVRIGERYEVDVYCQPGEPIAGWQADIEGIESVEMGEINGLIINRYPTTGAALASSGSVTRRILLATIHMPPAQSGTNTVKLENIIIGNPEGVRVPTVGNYEWITVGFKGIDENPAPIPTPMSPPDDFNEVPIAIGGAVATVAAGIGIYLWRRSNGRGQRVLSDDEVEKVERATG